MPRNHGSIGETKFKILAIIYTNTINGNNSYGYSIWTILKTRFHCYLDDDNLRNVYRHLKDLRGTGLIEKTIKQSSNNAPRRQLYSLTNNGKQLKHRFNKYLQILEMGL